MPYVVPAILSPAKEHHSIFSLDPEDHQDSSSDDLHEEAHIHGEHHHSRKPAIIQHVFKSIANLDDADGHLSPNGKKLKSSFKHFWSSPNLHLNSQSLAPSLQPSRSHDKVHCDHHALVRPRSKSTPSLPDTPSDSSLDTPPSISTPPSPTKAVRFPLQQCELTSVRVFRRHGKPISISRPAGEETETETEGESSASGFRYEANGGFMRNAFKGHARYPNTTFSNLRPKVPLSNLSYTSDELQPLYELDDAISSPIPRKVLDSQANVHLESLTFSSSTPKSPNPLLVGTILVRNVSYQKNVAVRFTLDDWVTTSDLTGTHVVTLPALPLIFVQGHSHSTTAGDIAGLASLACIPEEWDRFTFSVDLGPFSMDLNKRVLWLAVIYSANQGEWWDNNGGGNYKVGFRCKSVSNTQRGVTKSPEESRDRQPNPPFLPPRQFLPQGTRFNQDHWGPPQSLSQHPPPPHAPPFHEFILQNETWGYPRRIDPSTSF